MSNFTYGKHTENRIGVWLRYQTNDDLIEMIKDSKQMRLCDSVERIVVTEYDEKYDQVWLQIWCRNLIDTIRGKMRYNVFHIKTKVNVDWICEGDLGRGADIQIDALTYDR